MIKISFIVVAYNAAQTLGALLDDLLAQTLAPEQLEVLLVNSASSDGHPGHHGRLCPGAPRLT